MLYFIFSVAAGTAFGFLLVYVPFGKAILTAFLVVTGAFAARYFASRKFRDTNTAAVQMFFLVACWITVGIFHARPTGIDTYLPPMNLDNVRLAQVLDTWEKANPNLEFICDNNLRERKVTIFTITEISVGEGLDILDDRLGAEHTYREDTRGMSIARGPRVTVEIRPGGKMKNKKPFVYDAIQ